jgi:hypothetical protein
VQGCNRNTFASIERQTALRLLEFPKVSGTSIQEDRNKEKIYQSACLFGGVAFLLIPFSEKGSYAGNPADFEMLPAAMGRN